MKDKDLEQENLQHTDDGAIQSSDNSQSTDNNQITDDANAEENSSLVEPDAATADNASENNASEDNAEEADASADSDSAATPSETDEKKQEKPKKQRSIIGAAAFLLAICALLVSGYGFQKIQTLEAQNASLKEAADSISQSVENNGQSASSANSEAKAAKSQISSIKGDLAKQQQNVTELQDRLTRGMKKISNMGTEKRTDWLLAEVEYLLRLANQRVMMEKSPVGALALLKSSDTILKETDDVSIYNVRKAIAKDIAALEAVPTLDTDGIFLKLAALNEQVNRLRLIPISKRHEFPDLIDKVTPEAVAKSWGQDLKTSWSEAMTKLEKLVVIQQRDEDIKPLLSPEQVYFLQQNLHLMIEQAQLSLLQGHQDSYDASLQKATAWVSNYFDDDAATKAVLKGLNEIKPVNVSPELPDISSSLKALKSYLADVYSGEGAA